MVSHPSYYLDNSGISLRRAAENECVAYILLVRVSFWSREKRHITSWPLASGDKHLIGPSAGVARQKAENISHLGHSIKDVSTTCPPEFECSLLTFDLILALDVSVSICLCGSHAFIQRQMTPEEAM